jgi:protein-disulfide isomerase
MEKSRIFGVHFATLGIPFFVVALAFSVGRNSSSWELRCPYDGLMFGAAGAEWYLIALQKYIIQHYCPVCLTIAGAVYFAVVVRLLELVMREGNSRSTEKQGIKSLVASFIRGGIVFCALFVGLITALIGTSTPTVASVGAITQNIWLGDQDKPVEVLFVSDYFCPYCRKAEPAIDKMLPAIGKVARYTFLDDPIHESSYNFMPYNMSLLMNSKDTYLEGRKVLLSLAQKTTAPDDATVIAALASKGITLKMVEKSRLIRLASNEGGFLRANAVTLTPSIIVRNRRTGEHRLLAGADHVDEALVQAAVNAVSH